MKTIVRCLLLQKKLIILGIESLKKIALILNILLHCYKSVTFDW